MFTYSKEPAYIFWVNVVDFAYQNSCRQTSNKKIYPGILIMFISLRRCKPDLLFSMMYNLPSHWLYRYNEFNLWHNKDIYSHLSKETFCTITKSGNPRMNPRRVIPQPLNLALLVAPRIALRWELRGWGKRTWHFYLIHVYTDQKATSTVKQGYFTYTTLGGNRAVPGGNLRPSTGYWGKFPYKAGKCKHWCSSPSNTSRLDQCTSTSICGVITLRSNTALSKL